GEIVPTGLIGASWSRYLRSESGRDRPEKSPDTFLSGGGFLDSQRGLSRSQVAIARSVDALNHPTTFRGEPRLEISK
ncbi:MAG: hypothetical protein ACKO9Q_06270, partial [Pirellula sp.]